MKKTTLYFVILVFCACAELERSNPLDPKNPESAREMTVLVEAFINDSAGSVVDYAVSGLERLIREYDSQDLVYLEHHIAKTSGTDPLALDASLSRYNFFVPVSTEQGIPDVFFDGSANRVQGASSPESAYQRYNEKMQQELAFNCYFTIEGQFSIQDDQLKITADIARLGPDNASDLAVIAIIADDLSQNFRLLVRCISPVDTWSSIKTGEIRQVDQAIDLQAYWSPRIAVFLLIQSSRTGHVLGIKKL
ncbi:hypothetical protein JW935_29360 [candidate division KSB1 bacterium]|nr:hypothetical protein [candidate division KSB1 bacterium]